MAQGSNFKLEIRGWQRLCACAGWRAAACAHKDTGAKLRQRPYWELLGWDDLSWGTGRVQFQEQLRCSGTIFNIYITTHDELGLGLGTIAVYGLRPH